MKAFILLLFVSSCLAGPHGSNRVQGRNFESPAEIKTVVLACDTDKDGELNSEEFVACVSTNQNMIKTAKIELDRNPIIFVAL